MPQPYTDMDLRSAKIRFELLALNSPTRLPVLPVAYRIQMALETIHLNQHK